MKKQEKVDKNQKQFEAPEEDLAPATKRKKYDNTKEAVTVDSLKEKFLKKKK